MAFERLAGNPVALEDELAQIEASVAAIEDAADVLAQTETMLAGEAMIALYGLAIDAADDLEAARRRYAGTASALRRYVVEMESAHRDADAAIARSDSALSEQTSAHTALTNVKGVLSRAEDNGALASEVARLEHEVYLARRRVARADTAVHEVTAAWQDAHDRQVAAARAAAAAISDAMSETNNSVWDNVGGFFSAIGDAFAAVGSWLVDAIKAVGEFLFQFAGLLIIYLVIVVVLLVLTTLSLGAALLVAAAIFVMIAGVLLTASLVADSTGGPYRGADYPVETRTADPEGTGNPATPASYAELFRQDLQDLDWGTAYAPVYDLGGRFTGARQPRDDLASLVRVVALRDEDTGEVVGWRVELPSTQDWGLAGNSLNDLPTDVLHALAPWRQTEMEKAAWDAMEQAGVLDSDAPVMLTGWSQGGMTAGELAIDDRLSGRELSVVTGGSPVDCFRHEFAERGVRVTALTHPDVVSGLEGLRTTPVDLLASNPGFREYFDWTVDHSAAGYGAMAAARVPQVRPEDEVFFADFGEGVVEEVHLYEYTRHTPDVVLAPGAGEPDADREGQLV